jgi:hypothetical protein
MSIGNSVFNQKKDFDCSDTENILRNLFKININFIALNNDGAGLLLVVSLTLYLFSLMIWYVLYKIPDSFGLISKRHNKEAIAVDGLGNISQDVENEELNN